MRPKYHFGFGLIFSLIMLILFPGIGIIGAILILASSVLGDVDHYLIYVRKKKEFSLKKAYAYFEKMGPEAKNWMKVEMPLFLFHTVEFSALLVVLSFSIPFLFYIALGLLFHMILDLIEINKYEKDDVKYFSLIENILRRRN